MMNNVLYEEPVKKRKRKNEAEQNKEDEVNNTAVKNQIQRVYKKVIPKLRLKSTGDSASLLTPAKQRIPLTLTDIQHLLLHSLLGNINLSQSPRWYVLEKCEHISQITCIIFEGLSIEHWNKYNKNMHYAEKMFNLCVEILTPSIYNGTLVKELALVPLSESDRESIIQKYGSMNLALEARKDLMVMIKAVFPIDESISEQDNYSHEDSYPRTQLILSTWQLIEENYPLPLKGKLQHAYADYVMTKDTYKPVTANSPMFGLDCEMCLTSAGSELTRVSIVNEKHESIYETLVKPYNNITDYLTKFSGVTKSLLSDVEKRLEDVQRDIQDLLPPDAILVGQSLQTDLHALKMMHPYIIDTSLIFNFTGERAHKPKLKTLAKEFLNEDIQSGKNGHCPTEDSIASLKLVQLKLKKNMEFGDAVHTKRRDYKKNFKVIQKKEYGLSIFNHIIEQKKTSIVVGCDNITGDYYTYLTQAKESLNAQLKKSKLKKIKLCTVDDVNEVICKLSEVVSEYNLAMAHLKLETTNVDDELQQMKTIDEWIQKVWARVKQFGLFVIIFGGTTENNGMAMFKIKDTT